MKFSAVPYSDTYRSLCIVIRIVTWLCWWYTALLDTGVSVLILIKIKAHREREREREPGRVPEVRWGRVSYRFWGLGWARCQRRRTGDCRTWRGRRRRRFVLSEGWGVLRITGHLGHPPQTLACQSKEEHTPSTHTDSQGHTWGLCPCVCLSMYMFVCVWHGGRDCEQERKKESVDCLLLKG